MSDAYIVRRGYGGEAASLSGILYDSGNQYADVTGGWIKFCADIDVVFNAGNIYASGGTAERVNKSAIFTNNKIDVGAFSKLSVTAANDTATYSEIRLALTSDNTSYDPTFVSYVEIPKGSGKTELDISALTGSYYVAVWFRHTATCTITKIELS